MFSQEPITKHFADIKIEHAADVLGFNCHPRKHMLFSMKTAHSDTIKMLPAEMRMHYCHFI